MFACFPTIDEPVQLVVMYKLKTHKEKSNAWHVNSETVNSTSFKKENFKKYVVNRDVGKLTWVPFHCGLRAPLTVQTVPV